MARKALPEFPVAICDINCRATTRNTSLSMMKIINLYKKAHGPDRELVFQKKIRTVPDMNSPPAPCPEIRG
jgi:hypothetical protein